MMSGVSSCQVHQDALIADGFISVASVSANSAHWRMLFILELASRINKTLNEANFGKICAIKAKLESFHVAWCIEYVTTFSLLSKILVK